MVTGHAMVCSSSSAPVARHCIHQTGRVPTTTAFPPWYTGPTPSAHPPGVSGESPTPYPPGYTGETPTPAGPIQIAASIPTTLSTRLDGLTGGRVKLTPYHHAHGPTPSAHPPGVSGESPTPYPFYTGETPTPVWPPGHTQETPIPDISQHWTAPPMSTYPPLYTGPTPTAHLGYICNVPMTITNAQKVTDSQLTSSSSMLFSTSAFAGRLFNEHGAWVPFTNDGNQWLQVDLLRPMAVSGLLIQGSPVDDRWTTSFLLRYSNDGYSFQTYTGTNNIPTELSGSTDRNTVKTAFLSAPIMARFWRIVPVSWAPAGIALRFNLLGCEEQASPQPHLPLQQFCLQPDPL
ncbi:hypothetical protein C0Q70_10130 [Pomacea canaliculata]|uniref:F5/8 type C domain-containing protein n=1 Tax=Pomacea canaliculata TaxID=400727 RepID=A0A2T7PBR1_POMCA|nr:hypothetical protein C0Q70_10130 [Pomacea canaliculata]